MDEKIKTWTLGFPATENPNVKKALFDWPNVLQYDVKAKYRWISRKFLGMKFLQPERSLNNQTKATSVCIPSTNQSNRSISVRLLFLFCSCVFISRSYENRSNQSPVRHVFFLTKWNPVYVAKSFLVLLLENFRSVGNLLHGGIEVYTKIFSFN